MNKFTYLWAPGDSLTALKATRKDISAELSHCPLKRLQAERFILVIKVMDIVTGRQQWKAKRNINIFETLCLDGQSLRCACVPLVSENREMDKNGFIYMVIFTLYAYCSVSCIHRRVPGKLMQN